MFDSTFVFSEVKQRKYLLKCRHDVFKIIPSCVRGFLSFSPWLPAAPLRRSCNSSDFILTWLKPSCPSSSPGCPLSLNPSSGTSLFLVTLPQSFECLKAFPLILFPSTTGISAPSASPQSFWLFDCSPVKTRSETTVSF